HDKDVLKDIRALAGSRMHGRPDHDVARLVPSTASPPATVRGPGYGAAVGARDRFSLFRLAARAQVPRTARRAAKMPARRLVFSSAFTADPRRHRSIVSNLYSLNLVNL